MNFQVDTRSILTNIVELFRKNTTVILDELMINARRSGATKVECDIFQTKDEDILNNNAMIPETIKKFIINNTCIQKEKEKEANKYATCIVVKDNGEGCKDLKSFLNIGQSNWKELIKETEQPAGMGFLAMAGRPCFVISGKEGFIIRGNNEWRQGIITPINIDTHVDGTLVGYIEKDVHDHTGYNRDINFLKQYVKYRYKYYDMDILLNGKVIKHEEFLNYSNTIAIKELPGLECVIGLSRSNITSVYGGSFWHSDRIPQTDIFINYFGCIINESVDNPIVNKIQNISGIGRVYRNIRVNIIKTTYIKPELPNREKIVKNKYWHELMEEVEKIVLHTVLGRPHTLPYEFYKRATELGLPVLESMFYNEAGSHIEDFDFRYYTAIESSGIGYVVYPVVPDIHNYKEITVVDMGAFQKNYTSKVVLCDVFESYEDYGLYEHQEEYIGYSWYPKWEVIDIQSDYSTVFNKKGESCFNSFCSIRVVKHIFNIVTIRNKCTGETIELSYESMFGLERREDGSTYYDDIVKGLLISVDYLEHLSKDQLFLFNGGFNPDDFRDSADQIDDLWEQWCEFREAFIDPYLNPMKKLNKAVKAFNFTTKKTIIMIQSKETTFEVYTKEEPQPIIFKKEEL